MNIKSLLLGSAAVLVAATGARAADAIVIAEPEPVEYVRVCDTYGAGYFYIPGTETCMRIHGYVRGVISAGDNLGARTARNNIKEYAGASNIGSPIGTFAPTGYLRRIGVGGLVAGIENDTYNWMTRAQYRFSTATETELGTLRTYFDLRSQWSNGREAAGGSLRNAWIELGGFRMGLSDSSFVSWTNDYGTVYEDGMITPVAKRTNFISYTINGGNGLSAMIALEQGNNGADNNDAAYRDPVTGVLALGNNPFANGTSYGGFYDFRRSATVLPNTRFVNLGLVLANVPTVYARTKALGAQMDDYMPNVVGGVKYEQGWGGVSAVVAYDAFNDEFAGKARLDVNATDSLSLFAMVGYKSNDDSYRLDVTYATQTVEPGYNHLNHTYGVYRTYNSLYGDWGGDWAVWAGGQYRFNDDRTSFNLQLSYDDARTFAAAANVKHDILPGLQIQAELDYIKWDDNIGFAPTYDNVGNLTSAGIRSSLKGKDAFSGIVVLTRSF